MAGDFLPKRTNDGRKSDAVKKSDIPRPEDWLKRLRQNTNIYVLIQYSIKNSKSSAYFLILVVFSTCLYFWTLYFCFFIMKFIVPPWGLQNNIRLGISAHVCLNNKFLFWRFYVFLIQWCFRNWQPHFVDWLLFCVACLIYQLFSFSSFVSLLSLSFLKYILWALSL